ncbi:MAG: rhomboid family intramembrane serine protease [Sphingobacteriaceae bacterium]|nr:rhomboid family intramembrane serine protease [Sphingobacteriaceae bacterium]
MNFFQKIIHSFRQQGRLAQLIIINVALFLTLNLSVHILHIDLLPYLGLPIGETDFIFKIWTLVTYMFSHESLGHIFWNMLLFYYCAQLFYLILGESRLLYVYIMSGLSGAALLLICGILLPDSFSGSILIGASAAVTGVVMVMAIYAPNYQVSLWGIIQMPFKYFAILTFILSTFIDFSLNTGGKISHIGGAVFGLLYGLNLKKGYDFFNFSFLTKNRQKLKIVRGNKSEEVRNEDKRFAENRMNEILDKIAKSGYDSLSKKEKDELFNLSQKK